MRGIKLRWWLLLSWLLISPAYAQQVIQIPLCGSSLPANINPAAPTIAVNPSGQVCIAGSFSATVPTPNIVFPQPDSVVVTTVAGVISGAYANGSIVAAGSTSDGAATATFTSGSIITWLRGIFENTITPISVSGSFSATQTGNNIALVASQQIASPSTYGVAPVGSVLGVNAFVTSLPASPVSVGLPATPLSVVVANAPTVVPTGTLAVTPTPTPQTAVVPTANVTEIAGQTIASPSTYGVAPVGSVQGVNAFVTSLPASPLSVGIAGPTPLNVTISGSPVNITGSLSTTQTGNNIVQVAGQQIASPSTYGVAPVGSVQGVNAFVTSLPSSPITVAISTSPQGVAVVNNVAVTTPTPLQVTLPASPVSVGLPATPLNVTVGNASPTNVSIVQWQGTAVASPSTYGVAPVGSVGAVNAFVTNNASVTTPTPLQVTLPASPISVGIVPTPLNVTLVAIPGSPQAVTFPASPVSVGLATGISLVIPSNQMGAYVATTAYNVTGSLLGIGPTPGLLGVHQLAKVYCATTTPVATPPTAYLQIFDGSTTSQTVGTSLAKEVVAIAGSPVTVGGFTNTPPGDQFTQGITVAFTQGAFKSATAVGVNLNCTFAYN